MWSSWPWVMKMPRMRSSLSCRYEMSGMTRSTPSISSSGNIRPASTMAMSLPYATAIMFLPISPRPPRGISRTGETLARSCARGPCRVLMLIVLKPSLPRGNSPGGARACRAARVPVGCLRYPGYPGHLAHHWCRRGAASRSSIETHRRRAMRNQPGQSPPLYHPARERCIWVGLLPTRRWACYTVYDKSGGLRLRMRRGVGHPYSFSFSSSTSIRWHQKAGAHADGHANTYEVLPLMETAATELADVKKVRLGARVQASDGEAGKVIYMVADAARRTITHVGIRVGFLGSGGTFSVPMSLVVAGDSESLTISIPLADIQQKYAKVADGVRLADGTRVAANGRALGRLTQVTVHSDTLVLRHLVIERGLGREFLVPARAVTSISAKEIQVDLGVVKPDHLTPFRTDVELHDDV